jgi:hypothetical protein
MVEVVGRQACFLRKNSGAVLSAHAMRPYINGFGVGVRNSPTEYIRFLSIK